MMISVYISQFLSLNFNTLIASVVILYRYDLMSNKRWSSHEIIVRL